MIPETHFKAVPANVIKDGMKNYFPQNVVDVVAHDKMVATCIKQKVIDKLSVHGTKI